MSTQAEMGTKNWSSCLTNVEQTAGKNQVVLKQGCTPVDIIECIDLSWRTNVPGNYELIKLTVWLIAIPFSQGL